MTPAEITKAVDVAVASRHASVIAGVIDGLCRTHSGVHGCCCEWCSDLLAKYTEGKKYMHSLMRRAESMDYYDIGLAAVVAHQQRVLERLTSITQKAREA